MLAVGCPVVGREMLATGFPNDWLYQTMSYQLIQTTSFVMHPQLVVPLLASGCTVATCWLLPSQSPSAESLARKQNDVVSTYSNDIVLLSLTSSIICCFLLIVMSLLMSSLLSSPAGLLAPADLYSSADHDASPMTSSSMVHLDVPAGSLLMFQLVHLPLLALAAGSYRSNWFTMLQLVQLGLRLITNN
ncbi:hypothetical protein F511_37857 [Dorcoceras hygrometricum]|uniref:Uncharacterized protein n=1 Tax=Dorcoceras hygrometricum TaxID=472368 RepID=A0A2Z7CK06_9LAMI|nr:hypothetical protein F511_37857 [Dorcoceras hygrometricum]